MARSTFAGCSRRPQADWWARLPQPASIEELVHYWKGQVGSVLRSGRRDRHGPGSRLCAGGCAAPVAGGRRRFAKSWSTICRCGRGATRCGRPRRSWRKRKAGSNPCSAMIRAFRDREGLIDPAKTAEATGALATRLRDELVRANAELATLQDLYARRAPSVKVLKARIRSLEAQQRSLAHEMTDPDDVAFRHAVARPRLVRASWRASANSPRAAYQHALQSLDQARANADRQHVFIASFVPPSLPEEALYPRRWRSLGTIALMAFALWGIGGLTVQSIRDHLS